MSQQRNIQQIPVLLTEIQLTSQTKLFFFLINVLYIDAHIDAQYCIIKTFHCYDFPLDLQRKLIYEEDSIIHWLQEALSQGRWFRLKESMGISVILICVLAFVMRGLVQKRH